MKFKKSKTQQNVILSRKQRRKQDRKQKKARRNEYYTNRKKPGQFVLKPKDVIEKKGGKIKKNLQQESSSNKPLTVEQSQRKEKKELKKVQKEMNKNRKLQLQHANKEEDKTIKRLEKQLKLNKRKSKSIPKSFTKDGLDYLLEVCDPENMRDVALAEQQFDDMNDEFEEDLALMGNESNSDNNSDNEDLDEEMSDGITNDSDLSEDLASDLSDEEIEEDEFENQEGVSEDLDNIVGDTKEKQKHKLESTKTSKKKIKLRLNNLEVDADELSKNKKFKSASSKIIPENETELDFDQNEDLNDFDMETGDENSENEGQLKTDGTWTDIYGRLRNKDGSIIEQSSTAENKYIPPAIRAKLEGSTEDKNRLEKLTRLRRQLKGLLNRLAESNMYNISNQIEGLYMNNSRNDMNNTITSLMLDSLITNITTPERLLIEHVVLVTILHANVGTEVGAHFLQTVVKKFDELLHSDKARHVVEDKNLDNTINVISQLYNFKLFDSRLIYDILAKLSESFEEKDVECILHILKSIGFNLRKDDPIALKNLILNLQKQAANAPDSFKDNPRVKFMLDVLLAIKNNNVSKIPNYDTSYPEHLKKLIKGFIRKGNYVTQLNISLDDLLKVEERGRWWVVGSAWKGNISEAVEVKTNPEKPNFSQKLLDLARKQRMNTDTRRNIFCIIMSAEDYLDAFEKLLRLGLKNQQEREIIHVLIHCCLQEKKYNPYYAVLAQKFCESDRKFQMIIKYSVWDKLKALTECSGTQISNLAKMLSHLFLEKGLPISILKVVQFGELDKVNLRFMRQVLLGILLHDNEEAFREVFENIAKSDKLKMFRESLRLFVRHFLLRNIKTDVVPEKQKQILEQRGKIMDNILMKKDFNLL